MTQDLNRALESLKGHEKIRQPPPTEKPTDFDSRESDESESPYTGMNAVQYMTNLALLRDKRRRAAELEGEKERKEREEIERRLREEIMRVENDGSLEEFIKQRQSQNRGDEFERQLRYEPQNFDITPLMKQVASRIQAENNNYDPQLIAQSRAEIEAELRDIVVASARAIANDQSPVKHTTPVKVISNEKPKPILLKGEERKTLKNDAKEVTLDKSDEKPLTDKREGKGLEKERADGKGQSGPKESDIPLKMRKKGSTKRYPGFRPWPSLQDCAAMSLPKTLIFTSTWLSVTAKGVK